MAKSLIIVESRAKTRTLSGFVGPGYQIVACMGHVRDLPPDKLGVDIEHDFAPEYEPLAHRKPTLASLRRQTKAAKVVYLASDPDREGEAIAWHLTEALELREPRRIEFNEITRRAVQSALEHPRDIDMRRVNAQQARRILDRLVGYNLSPLLWRKLRRKELSAGRVQSVAVKLVADREREIEAFRPQEYWDIFADLTPGGKEPSFRAKLVKIEGAKAEVLTGEQAESVAADARTQPYVVARVKRADHRRSPLPPFITSTLQQEASARLGMAPRRTMMIAQQLYEGLELGPDGSVGLITYMRTDSTRVAQEAQAEAREYILGEFGVGYAPERPRQFAARKGAQEAHEAIRPTYVARHPDAVAQYLDRDQLRLYRLVWSRFVASQMAEAVLDVMVVDAAAGPYLFRVTGQAVRFPGFMRVYSPSKAAEEGAEIKLPVLEEGQELRLLNLETVQKFTQPPPRYTEASLVRALEAKGIGRPSTYAPILATIRERGYVYLDAKRLHPTDLGFVVTDQLSQHFPRIMDVEFTARVEEQLDQVERGASDWVELLREFYGPFAESLSQAEERMGAVRMPVRETQERCPQCEKPLLMRIGRHGPFLACSGYPQCRYARPVAEPNAGSEEDASATPGQCPECGAPLVIRRSRHGPFLGCSGYPKCRHIEPLAGDPARRRAKEPPQPTGETCDQCGKPMVVRSGKRGPFVGCSGYPKCRNTRSLAGSGAGEPKAVTADSS